MNYTAIFKKEDIGYSVFFPAIDGCVTEGDTREEAIANAKKALALILETQMCINTSFKFPKDITKGNYELEQGDFTQLIEFKNSPAGDSWENVRKELFSPKERAILDKEVDKICEEINKSNH